MASGLVAPVNIGSTTAGSGNPIAVTTTVTVAPGDGIAVFIGNSNIAATLSSVVDSRGNTYTATANSPATGSNRRGWISVCPVTGTAGLRAGDTVTINFSTATGAKAIRVVGLRGVKSTTAADRAPTAGSATSTTPSSGSTGTLSQADELELGLIVTDGVTADTFTIGGGFTLAGGSVFNTTTANVGLYPAYKIVTVATGDTYSATITSRAWVASIATYRAGTFPDTLKLASLDVEYDTAVGGNRSLAGLLVEADFNPAPVEVTVSATQGQAVALQSTYIPGTTTYPITSALAQGQSASLQAIYIPGTVSYPITVACTQATAVAFEQQSALALVVTANVGQQVSLVSMRLAEAARSFLVGARLTEFGVATRLTDFRVRGRRVRFTVEER